MSSPNMGEMVKPVELIEIKGAARLALADRRLFNILLLNAFGPELGSENRRFEIPLIELRETHDSNDRLVRSIEALMTTVVTIQRPDGSTDRVQLLGWNNLSDPKRRRGTLRYAIPPELAMLLRDSMVFAKLEIGGAALVHVEVRPRSLRGDRPSGPPSPRVHRGIRS